MDGRQFDLAVLHPCDPQTLRAKQQRISRHCHRVRGAWQLEVHGDICAGQQLPCRIIHIDLHEQRTRRRVDRIRVTRDSACKCVARKLREKQRGRCAGLGGAAILLGNTYKHAQPIDRRDVKELRRRSADARVNQSPDIRLARYYYAIERRPDLVRRSRENDCRA